MKRYIEGEIPPVENRIKSFSYKQKAVEEFRNRIAGGQPVTIAAEEMKHSVNTLRIWEDVVDGKVQEKPKKSNHTIVDIPIAPEPETGTVSAIFVTGSAEHVHAVLANSIASVLGGKK